MASSIGGTPAAHQKTGLDAGISTAKDFFGLLRDAGLGTFAVLLLLFPATFNERLVKAGFKSGNFGGLQWSAKLEESDAGLKEARAQMNDLVAQLALASGKLKEIEPKLNDPKIKADVATLDAKSMSVSTAAAKVEANVSKIISANAPLVESGQSANDGKWGVVYSGDTKLEPARYEVGPMAAKYEIPNAGIFMDKNGSYRSVAVVDTPEQAKQVLVRAKERRADAYIVRLSIWCPNRIQKEGYQACTAL